MTMNRIFVQFDSNAQEMGKRIDEMNGKFMQLNKINAHLAVSSNRFTNALANGLNKSSTEVVRFNGNMLSLLFFGMELKRIFLGALKSIFEGYKKIIPESSAFNRMTTKLSANWEFFKFQLADALANSPLFQKFIGFLIRVLQVFNSLPTPIKSMIGYLLIVGAVIGTILMFIGIWALGVGSLINQFGILKSAILNAGGAFNILSPTLLGFLATAALLALLFMGLNASLKKFHEHSDTGKKKWEKFKTTMTDVMGSALEPILEAIGAMNIDLNDLNEIMIVVGAIFQNVLVSIGMMLNALVPLIRTIVNGFSILIRTIKNASEMLWNFYNWDFDGVLKNWDDLKNGVVQDIDDITEAWKKSQTNFNELQGSIITGQEIEAALNDYRNSIALEAESSQSTSDVVIVGSIDQAADEGYLTPEQLQKIISANTSGY